MQVDVNPSKKKSFEPISLEEAIKIKGTKQSDRQLLCTLKSIRLKFGRKSVVPGVKDGMRDTKKTFGEFFSAEKRDLH